MSAEVSSHEKGLALELKLRDLFKSKGYEVLHNVKRKGRSGAEHQIDVLAEYRCPLHTSRVVVEAKSYDAPIDKDWIMKLIQIVDDLGAGKRRVKVTVNTTASVDALTGELVTLDEKGVAYPFGYLSGLDGEEISVVRATRSFTAASLTGLGFSEYKARRIANRLASKGVVKAYRPKRGPMVYKLEVPFPDDPRTLKSVSSTHPIEEKTGADKTFTPPSCDASAVIKALESYWFEVTVKNIFTTYYPYFACVLSAEDGSRRVEMLDAVSGIFLENTRHFSASGLICLEITFFPSRSFHEVTHSFGYEGIKRP